MTTLIAAYYGDRCVARCDARCYNAKGRACHCICGGENHGVGLNKATDNVQRHFQGTTGVTIDANAQITLRQLPETHDPTTTAAANRTPAPNQRPLF
jgi:hypothetical protein